MTPKLTDRLVRMLAVEVNAPVAFFEYCSHISVCQGTSYMTFEVIMSGGVEDTCLPEYDAVYFGVE